MSSAGWVGFPPLLFLRSKVLWVWGPPDAQPSRIEAYLGIRSVPRAPQKGGESCSFMHSFTDSPAQYSWLSTVLSICKRAAAGTHGGAMAMALAFTGLTLVSVESLGRGSGSVIFLMCAEHFLGPQVRGTLPEEVTSICLTHKA